MLKLAYFMLKVAYLCYIPCVQHACCTQTNNILLVTRLYSQLTPVRWYLGAWFLNMWTKWLVKHFKKPRPSYLMYRLDIING